VSSIFASIKVEVSACTEIVDVAYAMSHLAEKWKCPVDGVFNGTDIFAEPGESDEVIGERWSKSYQRKRNEDGTLKHVSDVTALAIETGAKS
jgi:hypothetical protein